MKRLLLFLFLYLLVFSVYSYENTYAVIVGVADYKYNSKKDLRYTINDAKAFYEFLKSEKGGSVPSSNIILLLDVNASKANILTKAKALFSKAKTNDRVIFYFSGHGGRGCFVPYDTDDWGRNLLYFDEVKSVFRCAKCKTKLLFADACFSGSMKKQLLRNSMYNKNYEKGVKTSSNMNIVVMMSCHDNEVSLELSNLKQGLFTYYLIQGLGGKANRDGSNYVTIQELFYYVYHKVIEKSTKIGRRQTPELFGKFNLRLIVSKI